MDIWGSALPANGAGLLYRHIDLIGTTMYEGWYQRPGEASAGIGVNVRRRVGHLEALFPGRVHVITEFGAEANTKNPSPAPGGFAFQARLLRASIHAFETDRSLDGWLIWSLQDFALTPTFGGGSIRVALPALRLVPGVNQKGLYTYGGHPKVSANVVRRLYEKAAGAG